MKRHKLTDRAVEQVLTGHRLLQEEDFQIPAAVRNQKDGNVIELGDAKGQFIARALIGKQNKGLAWVFTLDPKVYFNQLFLENCIEDAIEKRAHFFESEETTAFRIFNGEGDGLGGMTIDWYAGFLQINWYTRALYQESDWIKTLLEHFLPHHQGIYETKRFKLENEEQAVYHAQGQTAPQPLIVKENGIHYAVYLGSDLMTGIFLDQREVRAYLRNQAQEASVLNLFSYTGAFSVAAALGGAKRTVSIDVANRSLERTSEQFLLNGLVAPSNQHEIKVLDVFDYIQYAKRHHLTYQWVVCDPPSFARTKDYLFRVEKDYIKLINDLFDLTEVGGFCLISTNHAGYKKEELLEDIQRCLSKKKGVYHFIQSFGLPEDFPTSADFMSQYLKVLVYYRAA